MSYETITYEYQRRKHSSYEKVETVRCYQNRSYGYEKGHAKGYIEGYRDGCQDVERHDWSRRSGRDDGSSRYSDTASGSSRVAR